MDARLAELLHETRAEGNEQQAYTTFSYFGPRMNYPIQSSKMTEFWEGYCSLAEDNNKVLALAERPNGTAPIILYGKLRFHSESEDGFYQQKFLLSFVRCCQMAIEENFNLSDTRVELLCCVLESESDWTEGDLHVVHFRVQFPYCRADINVQTRLLRPRIIQLLRTTNVIGLLQQQPIGDWEQIIEATIPMDTIPLYRSVMNPIESKMALNYIWPVVTEQNLMDGTLPSLEINHVFRTPNNHYHVQQRLIDPQIFIEDYAEDFWLPLYLSVYYWIGVTTQKVQEIPTLTRTAGTVFTYGTPNVTLKDEMRIQNEDPEFSIVERLLPMLNIERTERENYWIDIGKALYNVTKGSEKGLHTWIQFTERSDTKSAEDCHLLYYGFQSSNITVKTIAWYAKQDSPQLYREWHKQWCQEAMEKASSTLHSDVAEALYRVYWLDYVCSSVSGSVWFKFRENRYVKLDSGVELSRSLSEDFLKRFESLRLIMLQKGMDITDNEQKEKYETLNKKISNLISKLKTVSYKANVMKEAREKFYVEGFSELLDKNESFMGMYNCVLECYENQCISRPGKPEDYVSKCTGIPSHEYTWESLPVKMLMKWLHQVFVDQELFHYVMKDFASFLKGRNSEKIFRIWTGCGDNSKSMIVKLFEAAFGSYIVKIPVELVTSKRQGSSGPNPEMAQTNGSRGAFMEEPDDDEPMKKGIIKRYTGGDSFFTRFLNDNGGKVEALFKLVLMCNRVPTIPNGDTAIRNRLRIIPFFSRWVKKNDPILPATEEERYLKKIFEMDPFFEKKIPQMASAFIWVLRQYYTVYIDEGLNNIPKVIEDETSKYWDENNCYQMYINECLEPAYTADGVTPDENSTLTHTEIYNSYKPWFRDTFPGIKVGVTPEARREFERILGPQKGRKWYGIKFREEEKTLTAGQILARRDL